MNFVMYCIYVNFVKELPQIPYTTNNDCIIFILTNLLPNMSVSV